jgi:hypothetical protein
MEEGGGDGGHQAKEAVGPKGEQHLTTFGSLLQHSQCKKICICII